MDELGYRTSTRRRDPGEKSDVEPTVAHTHTRAHTKNIWTPHILRRINQEDNESHSSAISVQTNLVLFIFNNI